MNVMFQTRVSENMMIDSIWGELNLYFWTSFLIGLGFLNMMFQTRVSEHMTIDSIWGELNLYFLNVVPYWFRFYERDVSN